MSDKIQLHEKLILFFLLCVFILSITIPPIHFLSTVYVRLFLFVTTITVYFSFKQIASISVKGSILLSTLLVAVIFVFLWSAFYVNFDANMNLDSILSILSFIMNFGLFFFILSKSLRLSERKFEFFTSLILYFAIALSVIGVLFHILGVHYLPQFANTTAGLFGHPNTASMFYTICIPVLMYKYFSKNISTLKFSLLMFLFLYVLLFTFSRAGYIGVGVGILIYTFYKSKTLFVFVTLFVLVVVFTVVLDFAGSKSDSSASRFLLWLAAVNIITQSTTSLLWGYGPDNAMSLFMNEKFFFGNEPVPNPHNLILLLTMQFGLVFTITMAVFIIAVLTKAVIVKIRNKKFANDQKLNLCITIIISLILQNMLEDFVASPRYFAMPVFLICLGYAYYTVQLQNIISSSEE